jgi:ribosomal protein S2
MRKHNFIYLSTKFIHIFRLQKTISNFNRNNFFLLFNIHLRHVIIMLRGKKREQTRLNIEVIE